MKHSFLTLALTSLLMALSSCQKSGGGGTAASPQPTTPTTTMPGLTNCSNCTGLNAGTPLLQKVQTQDSMQSISGEFQLMGNVTGHCTQPTEKRIICASGASALTGTLTITNSNYFCGFAQGTYTISPLESSQIQSAILSGGRYQAIGPAGARFELRLHWASFYNSQDSYGLHLNSQTNRTGLTASIIRPDGASCGTLVTY